MRGSTRERVHCRREAQGVQSARAKRASKTAPAGRVGIRQPREALLARWAGDGIGFPVNGEGAFLEACVLARLPTRVLRDGPDDRNPVLGLAADQHLGVGVALVDQVLGGKQAAAAERAVHHFDHVVVRRRGRRGFNVGDQAWSLLIAAFREVDLVAGPRSRRAWCYTGLLGHRAS